ncbi:MAG: formylglycine-generating enzyme family protein, partial [Pannonibacter indicus]
MTLIRYTSAAVAGLALLTLLQGFAAAPKAPHPAPETVRLEEAALAYREPGEFLDRGTPVNGPRVPLTLEAPLTIMRAQVTRGAYDACVADGACLALGTKGAPDLPVTGVNFIDAEAYAAWLSAKTGETWRLPTDREWALAAGSRFKDDAYTEISDPANPAYVAAVETDCGSHTHTLAPSQDGSDLFVYVSSYFPSAAFPDC